MFVFSREKKTSDDFKRWKVPELKEFLRNRGLKTTGTKDELTIIYCIGFRSGAAICTCESNHGRENTVIQKKKKYQSRLNVNGEQLPDPFTELKDNWIGEEKGVEKWPPLLQLPTDTTE